MANPIPCGVVVEVCQWMLPGTALLDRAASRIHVSHFSELTPMLAGAPWHVNRSTCPTWDDFVECRCMTEGR